MRKIEVKVEKTTKQKIATAIVILIVVLMIIGLFIIYLSPESTRNRYKYEVMSVYKPENYVEPEQTNVFKVTNMELLNNFKGNLPVSTGVAELRELYTEIVPHYLKQVEGMDRNSIKNYYNENYEVIEDDLHIDNVDSFLKMIEKFNDVKCDIASNIKQCNLVDNGKIEIIILFNNDQTVTCKMSGNYITTFKLEY